MTNSTQAVFDWLAGRDTGSSSKALACEYLASAMGAENKLLDYPFDPPDLGRCLRLIEIVPEIRTSVDKLAMRSIKWNNLAKFWDELSKTMDDEVGIHWEKAHSAPKTYGMMKAILNHKGN